MNGGFKASLRSLAWYALAATLLLPPFGCATDEREGGGSEGDAAVDDSRDSDGQPGVDDAGDNHGGEPGADDSGNNDGPDVAVDNQPDSAGEIPSPSDGGGFGEASAREMDDADHSAVMPCSGYTQLRTGMNYGEYSLYAIRIAEGLEAGDYVLDASEVEDGSVAVTKDDTQLGVFTYDPDAVFNGTERQTIVFDGYFELDVGGSEGTELTGLAASIFDGCHFVYVSEAPVIEQGGEFGPFVIVDVVVDVEAPSGNYTFHTESGNAGNVEMHRDGETVTSLEYAWMTTIGGGASYVFEFAGLVSIEVTRDMGTSNLFGLAEVLFDGRSQLVIP